MKRRNFLAGTAALAAIPLLPVQAKEVWYYRGVKVTVKRLPDYVGMSFYANDGRKFGVGYRGTRPDEAVVRACRRTIDHLAASGWL